MIAATRTLVLLSTLAAAWLLAWFGAAGLATLVPAASAAFALAFAAGWLAPGLVSRIVLFLVYLSPATFLVLTGRNHFTFEIVWLAGLLGLVVSGRSAWQWHVPQPWRWPVVAWALIVSVSWPIVLLREFDFAPWIAGLSRVSNTSIGIAPELAGTWIVYVVLTHNVGLLWFDWLCRRYTRNVAALRTDVLLPLAAAVTLSCIVGLYQAGVDVHFLSGHLWPHMGRAAGTLMDANAFGMLAALWGPALVALALSPGGTRAAVAAVGVLSLSVLGVWASGSRTALLAAAIGLMSVAWLTWRGVRAGRDRGALLSRRNLVVGATVLGVVMASLLFMARTPGMSPYERARHLIPGLESTVGESLWLLWDRMGYGAAAVLMIEEHPWVGVGVGSYHTLAHDFAVEAGGYQVPPDNAQNWFRHQLAELGLLGSLPWIAWTALFVPVLLRRAPPEPDGATLVLLRGSIVAFGAVSLVGMPGQSPAIIITFWTFVFWFLQAGSATPPQVPPDSRPMPRLGWVLVLLLVAGHAGATYVLARGDLRPAHRAARFGWFYRYGLYDLERPPDGAPFRWTMRKAVAVIPVEGRTLDLEAWVDHPDADVTPVDVRIRAGDDVVARQRVRRGDRVTASVDVPSGQYFVILSTEVDRAWRPSDHGGSDTRELGLAIRDWRWR